MAHATPKIQYKNLSMTGDISSGSDTISDIADVNEIEVGMFVRGTGIPTGATVGSIGANSVTLASGVQATATTNDLAITFGHEIVFDYPPIEQNGEQYDAKATISESLSGQRQVALNHIEITRNLKFAFLSHSLYLQMIDFLEDHALNGGDFRYFDDATSVNYVTYELDALKVAPKKIAPKTNSTYVWEIPLIFRRVL